MVEIRDKSEAALASVVVSWLLADGWEVFQEVQPARGSHVADIVARRGKVLWVIECKCSFSLKLIEQAVGWIGFAHFVSVAVPKIQRFALNVCQRFGVGVLRVRPGDGRIPTYVDIEADAPFQRKIVGYFLGESLHEEQKSFAVAGNAQGRRWTPYQQTCAELRQVVRCRPGISLKEAIAAIRHHYASTISARCSLAKWLDGGKIPGIRIEQEGRLIRLYPREMPRGETDEE